VLNRPASTFQHQGNSLQAIAAASATRVTSEHAFQRILTPSGDRAITDSFFCCHLLQTGNQESSGIPIAHNFPESQGQ